MTTRRRSSDKNANLTQLLDELKKLQPVREIEISSILQNRDDSSCLICGEKTQDETLCGPTIERFINKKQSIG